MYATAHAQIAPAIPHTPLQRLWQRELEADAWQRVELALQPPWHEGAGVHTHVHTHRATLLKPVLHLQTQRRMRAAIVSNMAFPEINYLHIP